MADRKRLLVESRGFFLFGIGHDATISILRRISTFGSLKIRKYHTGLGFKIIGNAGPLDGCLRETDQRLEARWRFVGTFENHPVISDRSAPGAPESILGDFPPPVVASGHRPLDVVSWGR